MKTPVTIIEALHRRGWLEEKTPEALRTALLEGRLDKPRILLLPGVGADSWKNLLQFLKLREVVRYVTDA